MSPTAGVSFLDVRMSEWLQRSPHEGIKSGEASVIEYLRRVYDGDGCKKWPSRTAAWLSVRLITKVLVVPHGRHTVRTIAEIQKAYLPLVRDLVCLPLGTPFLSPNLTFALYLSNHL